MIRFVTVGYCPSQFPILFRGREGAPPPPMMDGRRLALKASFFAPSCAPVCYDQETMQYRIKPLWILLPLLAAAFVWLVSRDFPLSVAVFGVLLMPALIGLYIPYARDNPKNLWFKRKLYGWGWTPVTWQGWLMTAVYVGLVTASALTIDENSPPQEVAFTFILPAVLLTIAFIRIAYKKGESPRWTWGR